MERQMWRHIPWVANGLTVQGALEMVAALAVLVGGSDSDTRAPSTLYGTLLQYVAPPVLLIFGGLKAFAANRTRRFRGRRIGLAGLWSAIPTAWVWLCAPSGLALLIYGLLVLRDRTVHHAFALGDSGKSVEEVVAILNAPLATNP
jgi:hypothetical protein